MQKVLPDTCFLFVVFVSLLWKLTADINDNVLLVPPPPQPPPFSCLDSVVGTGQASIFDGF